jgi:hypothetical protein
MMATRLPKPRPECVGRVERDEPRAKDGYTIGDAIDFVRLWVEITTVRFSVRSRMMSAAFRARFDEAGRWLVQQHDRWIVEQCARQRHL